MKMAEISKTVNIVRLNNENYATWSFEVEMLLRRDDLWQYIEEERAVNDVKWKRRREGVGNNFVCL